MESNIFAYNEASSVLKALAHPIRLCILRHLAEQTVQGTELPNVSHLQSCVSIPQSTLSQHLQKLRMAGIITGKRHGIEIVYEISDERVLEILNCFFDEHKK